MSEYCPNSSYCRGELNIHENEVEIEFYCCGCGYYKIEKKTVLSKILHRKDFIYEKREKKKKRKYDKFDSKD